MNGSEQMRPSVSEYHTNGEARGQSQAAERDTERARAKSENPVGFGEDPE